MNYDFCSGVLGGGSFGVYLWNSSVALDSTTIHTGDGAWGGLGGPGGDGGAGGLGGLGGAGLGWFGATEQRFYQGKPYLHDCYGYEDCSGGGGAGGTGGNGGKGGDGGNAPGGPSIGVLLGDGSTATLDVLFIIGHVTGFNARSIRKHYSVRFSQWC